MIVKELIQRTDCEAVAQIWNESYRFDQDEPYNEKELVQALCVHLELLLNIHPVPTQGRFLVKSRDITQGVPDSDQKIQSVQVRPLSDQGLSWPDSVEEILGLTIDPDSFRDASEEQAVIAAVLHQIFFKNQLGNRQQKNIA